MVTQSGKKLIGSGEYDKTAHGGHGKGQKLLSTWAGPGRDKATPHAGGAVVRDSVEGHGSPKRGYQIDAHSPSHHGRNGEAVGVKGDFRPMSYDGNLHSEGTSMAHVGAKTNAKHGAATARAEHHPAPTGQPHRFKEGSVSAAHGYGHAPAQREGVFRNSGHSKAHQVGKR
jgi:hypothetical protein